MAVNAEEQDRARTHLLAAQRLFETLEYEQALEQLSLARPFAQLEAQAVLLSLYEGLIQAESGKHEQSDAAFKTALRLRPEAKLPVVASPKVEQRFEVIRQEVERELGEAARAQAKRPSGAETSAAESHVPSQSAVEVAAVSSGRDVDDHAVRVRTWLPAAVGGGLFAGAGVAFLLSRNERSRLREDAPGFATLEDARRSASRGQTLQTVSFCLAGVGLVSLGVSAGAYLWGQKTVPRDEAISMSTDGTSAFVSGRWP
ncbi:hypothetical protein FJV41_32330 [Myxococcus llanfairpwllgwyngyllgogerychwyrndrobwllllantysiliogogogochensis]|uniref:Uncharacterized protein n=1 Tax=Myxococcus llanfairpwllgwyngyllgogerychwyrndrobwllllantysiliogogogochensis TaxID=2590453 RepID=A0A540WS29_9BACT|nr:hypothetical protein FJV41_32330 [Myxococcus llanfairpwllgwyngyllgogerychwyrndrobwllllantysiliogogogochensis]